MQIILELALVHTHQQDDELFPASCCTNLVGLKKYVLSQKDTVQFDEGRLVQKVSTFETFF